MPNISTEILRYPTDLEKISTLLKGGQCIALPTETVYGLAADASQPEAVAKIFAAKQRPQNHPLIVHIADVTQLSNWAAAVPPIAKTLAKAFWPGPLSMLFDKAPHVPDAVTGGKPSIVLRVPSHPVFSAILQHSKLGLAAPSANLYKTISPTKADHVVSTLGGRIPAVVDGGDSHQGIESTIVDVRGEDLVILRPGPISAEQIEAATGRNVIRQNVTGEAVPGNVKQHYQPQTPAFLKSVDEITEGLANNPNVGLISCSSQFSALVFETGKHLHLSCDHRVYAKGLYGALHALDAEGVDEIWIEHPPQEAEWVAILDRVSRAVA